MDKKKIINELNTIVESDNRKKVTEVKVEDYENTINRFVVRDDEFLKNLNVNLCDNFDIMEKMKIEKFNGGNHDSVDDLEYLNLISNSVFTPIEFSSQIIQKEYFKYVEYNGNIYKSQYINGKFIIERV